MFKESGHTGNLKSSLSAERILGFCPWLWAFQDIWTEGISSEVGSLHILTPEFLNQELDRNDASVDVLFYMEQSGIRTTRSVEKDERMNEEFRTEPNPSADGKTIAERIIAAMRVPHDRIVHLLSIGKLYIPHIVVRTPGLVDRSSHFHIYTAPGNIAPNTVPMILECAGDFTPRIFKKTAHAEAPA